jgi:predicted translin family RNA/ssDNA-binding protein
MPLQAIFGEAKTVLDALHDEREDVIRICRDINSHAKKLIFTLHRASALSPNRAAVENHLKILAEKLATLYYGYAHRHSYHSYKGTVSNCVEELIEALLFAHYLAHRTLLLFEKLQYVVALLIQSYNYDTKQASEEPLAACIDILLSQPEKPLHIDVHNRLQVAQMSHSVLLPGDYFMGIFDFTGELMRSTITEMAHRDASSPRISPDVLENLQFLRLLYSHVTLLVANYPHLNVSRGIFTTDAKQTSSLRKKLEVMRQSVEKVESAICDAAINGNEPTMASGF